MEKKQKAQDTADGKQLRPVLDPADPAGTSIHVSLPEPGEGSACEDSQDAEASHFVKTLDENRQISRVPGEMEPGTTHELTIENGEKRLHRRRFSAY